jgi:hypothetical protein
VSRYEVNKVMRTVILMKDGEFDDYQRDRAAVLNGRNLTSEEHAALRDVDYPKLYGWVRTHSC